MNIINKGTAYLCRLTLVKLLRPQWLSARLKTVTYPLHCGTLLQPAQDRGRGQQRRCHPQTWRLHLLSHSDGENIHWLRKSCDSYCQKWQQKVKMHVFDTIANIMWEKEKRVRKGRGEKLTNHTNKEEFLTGKSTFPNVNLFHQVPWFCVCSLWHLGHEHIAMFL